MTKAGHEPLAAVYFDNVRDSQIGGQTDGVSPEVAADLGYDLAVDVPSLPADAAADQGVAPITAAPRAEDFERVDNSPSSGYRTIGRRTRAVGFSGLALARRQLHASDEVDQESVN